VQHITLSKLIHWYNITWYNEILKKKIEYHIFNSSNVLHNVLLRYYIVQILIHWHFNIDDQNWTFQPTWKP
jgi:hypothetical protein